MFCHIRSLGTSPNISLECQNISIGVVFLKMVSKTESFKGYGCVVLAAALWASSGSFSKYLFNKAGFTAFDLVQARITIAAVFMFAAFLIFDRSKLRISRDSAGYFFWLGCVGMAIVQFTYLFAISRINVASAILIQYLAPAFIAFFFLITGREKISAVTISAIMMSTIGCFFVASGKRMGLGEMNVYGVISALCSAVAFAFYSIKGEEGMRKYDPATVLFYALVFAALAWNVLKMPFSWVWSVHDYLGLGAIIYIAVLGTVAPFLLYFWGIKMIRPTRACITATVEPIIAGAISWGLVGEKMDFVQILGGMLVILSVILLQLKSESSEAGGVDENLQAV